MHPNLSTSRYHQGRLPVQATIPTTLLLPRGPSANSSRMNLTSLSCLEASRLRPGCRLESSSPPHCGPCDPGPCPLPSALAPCQQVVEARSVHLSVPRPGPFLSDTQQEDYAPQTRKDTANRKMS